ncbi:MAG: hypothetical protein AAGF67_06155 [Verrucomicrobiota bacterium]
MMKKLHLLLLITFAVSQVMGQAPEAGFLKVVNLISLKSSTFVQLGDFKFNGGDAITAGDDSGTLMIAPKEYTLTVSNDLADPKSESVDFAVENGKTIIVMCYDELMEKSNNEQIHRIRFNLLTETFEGDFPRLSIVSLMKMSSIPIQVNEETVILENRQAHRINPEIDDSVEIRFDNRLLEDIAIEKPVHYIAFIYRDPETGEAALSLIQNRKLEYQAPLDDTEED